jgi:hypothetical protein
MSTDAGTSEAASLSDELAKAAELLKSKGLDHAAAHLLAPETAKTVEREEKAAEKTAAPKLKVVRTAAKAKSVRKVKAKAKTAVKAKAQAKAKPAVKASAKAKTAKTAKAAKHKPVSGQSGPRIAELGWEDLNKKEKLVIGVFDIEGEREVRTIEQIGAEAFQNQTLKKQNSWTRNSLRRLMRAGIWLEKVEPGKYRLTQAARTKLRS